MIIRRSLKRQHELFLSIWKRLLEDIGDYPRLKAWAKDGIDLTSIGPEQFQLMVRYASLSVLGWDTLFTEVRWYDEQLAERKRSSYVPQLSGLLEKAFERAEGYRQQGRGIAAGRIALGIIRALEHKKQYKDTIEKAFTVLLGLPNGRSFPDCEAGVALSDHAYLSKIAWMHRRSIGFFQRRRNKPAWNKLFALYGINPDWEEEWSTHQGPLSAFWDMDLRDNTDADLARLWEKRQYRGDLEAWFPGLADTLALATIDQRPSLPLPVNDCFF